MSLVIALFDIESTSGIEMEFMRNVLDQLKVRVDEIVKHPRCFTSTIHYLTMKGIYDLEMIESVMKQNFIHFAYGENFYAFYVLTQDVCKVFKGVVTCANFRGVFTIKFKKMKNTLKISLQKF